MANEIRGDISIRGADKASRDLRNVGDSAAKAGDQVEELGKDAKGAAKGVDALGDQAKDADGKLGDLGDQAGYVSREVQRLQQHIKDLAAELDRTGDQSLLKDIGKAQRQTRKLTKIGDLLPDPDPKPGLAFGQAFVKSAGAAIAAGGPYVAGAAAAAAVASTPLIGSSIAAAVLGGTGAGGIIGGIALAAQDPRVKAAAEQFAAGAMGDLGTQLGAPFVQPTIEALQLLGSTVEDVSGDLGAPFAALSREVGPLVKGIDGMARNAVPGMTEALEAARPILRALANQLPEIGAAISDMLASFAEGGDGATMALDVLLDAVKGTMIMIGDLVSILGQTYEAMVTVGMAAGDWADDMGLLVKVLFPATVLIGGLNDLLSGQVNALEAANGEAPTFADNLGNIGDQAGTAAKQAEELNTAIDRMFDQFLGLKDASINYEEALDKMVEGLGDGKRTLDESSEAGRENWRVIQDGVRAANDMRQANIDSGMAVAEADAKWQAQIATLRANSVAILGNQKALADYWVSVDAIPAVTRKSIEFKLFVNDAQAWSSIRAIERRAAEAGNPTANPVERRAHGGPTVAGRTYLVGEHGPELRSDLGNGYITPAAQTAAIMSGQAGGGLAPINLNVVVSAKASDATIGAALAAFMVPYIQVEVINQGGIVQDTLGRPPR